MLDSATRLSTYDRTLPLVNRGRHGDVILNQNHPDIPILKKFPDTLCCPVSLVQSMIGLAERKDIKEIFPESTKLTCEFLDRVIRELSEDLEICANNQLTTEAKAIGTNTDNIICALRKFLGRRNLKLVNPRWLGWGAGERDAANFQPPSVEEIYADVKNPQRAVLGQVGWYTAARNEEHQRKGGHFVSITDCYRAKNLLSLHDPSPLANGKETKIKLETLDSGILSTGQQTTSAKDYPVLAGAILEPGESRAITVLDAIFSFGIERKNQASPRAKELFLQNS